MEHDHLVKPASTILIRRAGAFLIDAALCSYFIEQLAVNVISNWALNVLGFLIVVFYFILEGSVLGGRSFGKRLFKLKVVSRSGKNLGRRLYLPRSILMGCMLGFQSGGGYSPTIGILILVMFTTLWIVMAISVFLNPDRRSLLDILSKVAVVADKEPDGATAVYQGLYTRTYVASLAIFVLAACFAGGFITHFHRTLEAAEKVRAAIMAHVDRDVEIRTVHTNVNGISSVILEAIIYVYSAENDDPALIKKYFAEYQTLKDLNFNKTTTHLQVNLYSVKRFYGLLPLPYTIKGKPLPLSAVLSKTLDGVLKACEFDNDILACSNAAKLFADQKDLERAIIYATKGCDHNDSLGCYNLACFECRSGNPVQALNAFAKGIEIFLAHPNQDNAWPQSTTDPDLDCIKEQSQFARLLHKLPVAK